MKINPPLSVTHSQEGIEVLAPRYPNRTGLMVNRSNDGKTVAVIWDGLSSKQVYSSRFIRVVDDRKPIDIDMRGLLRGEYP